MLGLCLASLLSQPQVLENVPMVGRGKEWRGVSGTEPKLLGFLRMVERALHLVLQAFQEMFPLWEQQLSLGFKRLRAPESSCPPAEHSWSSKVKPVRGASQAVSGRSSGSHCRGEQTEKVFTRNHSHLKKRTLPKSASYSLCTAPREVCLQRCDVVVIPSVLRGASTGQLELLGSVGQLERSVGVSRVGQQCALPF